MCYVLGHAESPHAFFLQNGGKRSDDCMYMKTKFCLTHTAQKILHQATSHVQPALHPQRCRCCEANSELPLILSGLSSGPGPHRSLCSKPASMGCKSIKETIKPCKPNLTAMFSKSLDSSDFLPLHLGQKPLLENQIKAIWSAAQRCSLCDP